jgi:hypothetical protein
MDILAQLKAERDKAAHQLNALDTAIGALSGLNRGGRGSVARPRRRISAAGRARIAAAARARWARVKGQQKVVPIASKTGKRTMSASARRKIAIAQRVRWAKIRKQGRSS